MSCGQGGKRTLVSQLKDQRSTNRATLLGWVGLSHIVVEHFSPYTYESIASVKVCHQWPESENSRQCNHGHKKFWCISKLFEQRWIDAPSRNNNWNANFLCMLMEKPVGLTQTNEHNAKHCPGCTGDAYTSVGYQTFYLTIIGNTN